MPLWEIPTQRLYRLSRARQESQQHGQTINRNLLALRERTQFGREENAARIRNAQNPRRLLGPPVPRPRSVADAFAAAFPPGSVEATRGQRNEAIVAGLGSPLTTAGVPPLATGASRLSPAATSLITPLVSPERQAWLERQGVVGQAVNRTLVPLTAPLGLAATAVAPELTLGGTGAMFAGSVGGGVAEQLGAPRNIAGTGIGTRSLAEGVLGVAGGGLETKVGQRIAGRLATDAETAVRAGAANAPEAIRGFRANPELGGTRLPGGVNPDDAISKATEAFNSIPKGYQPQVSRMRQAREAAQKAVDANPTAANKRRLSGLVAAQKETFRQFGVDAETAFLGDEIASDPLWMHDISSIVEGATSSDAIALRRMHKQAVDDAISKGKPVPSAAFAETPREIEPVAPPLTETPRLATPRGVEPDVPPPVGNRPGPLRRYAPRLYRETNARGVEDALQGGYGGPQRDLYFAATPEMALGQGENKGILLELSSDKVEGRVRKKPGWDFAWGQGNAEFVSRMSPDRIKDHLLSVTVRPGTKVTGAMEGGFEQLRRRGWTASTLPDGSIKWESPTPSLRGAVEPDVPPPVEPPVGEGVGGEPPRVGPVTGFRSPDESFGRLADAIDRQRENIAKAKPTISEERGARLQLSEDVYDKAIADGLPPEQAFALKRAAQRGEYTHPDATTLDIDEQDFHNIYQAIEGHDFGRGWARADWQRDTTRGAFFKFLGGERLREHELINLEKVIGSPAAAAIRKAQQGAAGWSRIYDAIVAPKAFLSAFDLSYPFRQGAMLAPGHPVEFLQSFLPMFRAFGKEDASQQIFKNIVDDNRIIKLADGPEVTRGQFAIDTNLVRDIDPASDNAEEVFQSHLAERIPGLGKIVRASNRAFTTFGNKFRKDVADTLLGNWERDGVEIDQQRLQNLSNMLNRFSGRGTLKMPFQEHEASSVAKLLEATWWAPRYRLSGPQAFAQAFNFGDRAVQKEAARNLMAFAGTGMAIMGAAYLGGAKVTLDPRSSQFGKIQVGNTRVNIWGTNSLLVRSAVQFLTSSKIDDVTGELRHIKSGDVAVRYFRSGLAPEWSAIWDSMSGKNYLGQPLGLNKETFVREGVNRSVPLFLQDVYEAFHNNGPVAGAATTPLALFGVGVQNYKPRASDPLRLMPKYEGVTLEQQRAMFDFRKVVDDAYEEIKTADPETKMTHLQIAQSVAQDYPDPDIAAFGQAYYADKLPLNWQRLDYIIQNQDDLDAMTLKRSVPISIARQILSPENKKRYDSVDIRITYEE